MLRILFTKLTSLAMVALVLLIGAGAALSGDLPSGVQDAVAEAASAVGFDVPTSGDQGQWGAQDAAPRSHDRVQAVHETIDVHTSALDAWTTCVTEAAASRGSLQSDPDTRVDSMVLKAGTHQTSREDLTTQVSPTTLAVQTTQDRRPSAPEPRTSLRGPQADSRYPSRDTVEAPITAHMLA
jgi:hypothetical protein